MIKEIYDKYFRGRKIPFISSVVNLCLRIYHLDYVQWLWHHAWLNDRDYIMRKYKQELGVYPDLEHPKNFNEKNNWRKLNDRKDIYTLMVDKFRVKEIIEKRVGAKYMFKLLGHWDRPEDINFDSLPAKFVLKPNHSGGVLICRDKATFDRKRAIKLLKKALTRNFFILSREWPYKNVKHCIIAEEYMGEGLVDYKNYVFNGKVLYTFVWKNIPSGDGKPKAHICGVYDRNWQRTDIEIDYPSMDIEIAKPKCYDEMVRVAEAMAKDTIFVRCDCYIIEDHPYVGEMTFFPWGGFQRFKDEKWNIYLGLLEELSI